VPRKAHFIQYLVKKPLFNGFLAPNFENIFTSNL
jgi:hypothetical protein